MDNNLLKATLDAIDKVVNTDEYGMFRYFLGTISIEETKRAVAATNGRTLYVGPDFLKYSEGERAGIIIHELWHIITDDPFNGVGKDPDLWNIVIDIINNDFIDKQPLGKYGISLPKDALRDPKIAAMIKDQAYDYLIDQCKKQGYFEIMGKKLNCMGGGGALGDMKDVIPNDNATDQQETKRRLEESERQYEESAGHGSWLRDYLGRNAQAKLPWQSIVQQYLKKLAAVDYTWSPPKQIYGVAKEPLTLPRLRTKSVKLAIAVDTSGSIDNDMLSVFLAEMNRLISVIWSGMRFSGVLMLTTSEVYYSQPIPPIPTKYSVIKKLETGGTDFRPAFNLIREKYHDDVDLFIYFTDGYGDYPKIPPKYPVLWVVITSPERLKESKNYPPFGKVIPL